MTKVRSYFRSMVLVAGLSTLAACQTMSGAGLTTSEVTAELTPESAGAISEDMVAKLAEQIGPGSTTIALLSDGSVFGAALEASLRSW
ncbi:MAG: conjugal transfer protein TrbH, partial [Nitratireductor sp.]